MDEEYFGWAKFKETDKSYFEYIEQVTSWNIEPKDFIYQFPVFVGHVNLGRYLFFYELYKQVMGLNGHIAEVGTFKGSSFLFFTKLIKLFEEYNTTQVHGFDWFEGMQPSLQDDLNQANKYLADYSTLVELIKLQKLQNIAILHKMDVTKDLDKFFAMHPHLRFKIVFIDCGIASVLEKSLECFWPRLVKGGILIMDHYNCEVSPSESAILEQYIGNNKILQMPFNRQPTCYVIKES